VLEKLKVNEERLMQHGAVHLGRDIASYERK